MGRDHPGRPRRLTEAKLATTRASIAGGQPVDQAAETLGISRATLFRHFATSGPARTFAPGEEIPPEVTEVYDLDGDVWDRQATDPTSTLRDAWKMRDFDPDEDESAAQGVWLTPHLLDRYGLLTELPSEAAH